jgi:hypothetical protein
MFARTGQSVSLQTQNFDSEEEDNFDFMAVPF